MVALRRAAAPARQARRSGKALSRQFCVAMELSVCWPSRVVEAAETASANMREYVALLNRFHADEYADLDLIEAFWVARVQEFFVAKPFRIRLGASRSLRLVVRDVLEQAEERQKAALGVWYVGAVMQHMVGAKKLDCVLGRGKIEHNSFTTSDEQSGRQGDFFLGDVAIPRHQLARRSDDRTLPRQSR
jgi:hypothetical protein